MDKNSKKLLNFLKDQKNLGNVDFNINKFSSQYATELSMSQSDIKACIDFLIKQGYLNEITTNAWNNINKRTEPTVTGFHLTHEARNSTEFSIITFKNSLKKNIIAITALIVSISGLIVSIIALFK